MLEKHFVSFYSPGSFSCEFITEEIDRWDVKKACERAKALKKECGMTPIAFDFRTRRREDDELDSKLVKKSPIYHINGKIIDISQVKDEDLLSAMRLGNFKSIVQTYNGIDHNEMFAEGDQILEINF